ncbi:efflux RND transporter periplasmic adaptor subunit [Pelosinus sp. sgz500959]|uniref:efflux RND transporter periplasmic adaptor subunit n=1 Tax=Pelosinus sp. sgz500959 TaxID=3242472 RepID=UPI003670D79E
MKKSIASCTVIFILLLSFSLTGCSKVETIKAEIPLVRSQIVKMETSGQGANYSGEVRGRYETQLAFQVGGKVIKRNVELGSTVQPGDILMEIDGKDITQTVNMSAAQVASAQSQLKLAETNLERYRTLCEQGAISRAQLDQYQNAYEVALAAVRQSSAQYTQGTNQLGYSTLVADSTGVISSITAEAGQVVSAGQAILTIVKDGEREIEINIPENRVDQMRNVKQVRISFWALPDVVIEGKIREISPMADKISRTYKTRVSLLNPPASVQLGMTANVTVGNSINQQAVYVPLTAIYQTGNIPNIWIIKDGIVNLQPVKVGVFGDGKIQILEGLQDGDVIVTGGVQKLREGEKVRI